jgi:sec-independent protein translocase protein TatB
MIGDIGFSEMAVIAVIAIVVFGPDKLPELAKQAAAVVRKIRDFSVAATDELRTQLGDDYSDLELRDLDPRVMVRKHVIDAMEHASADAADADDSDGATETSHDAGSESNEPATSHLTT